MINRTISFAAAACLLMLGGCGESGSPTLTAADTASGDSPAWLLTSAPEGATGVAALKTSAAEGDAVVLHGRIGGRKDPMSADSATFIVMDPAIPSCADEEGDQCKTPWDYCCETPESITANNATVQLVGADGAPLAINLTRHGLSPLDEVIVVGTVAARPNPQTLVVKATGLYRAGG
ncbi:MAG: hypothetical protein ACF8R7_03980 [Phycisphaerales bacterium JB039]